MELPHKSHVAVVDGERFVLFRNAGSSAEPRLEDAQEVTVEGENFSAGVKHQDPVSQRHGRTDLEELAHATAAAEWLNRAALDGTIEKLVVIADPKSLGEMRRHYHGKLEEKLVGEVDKTMTGEPADKIAKAIAAA